MRLLAGLLVLGSALAQSWVLRNSGVTASLRGLSAVNSRVVWASGTGGTWLRTVDAGAHWEHGAVAGIADLDFRGVRAFSAADAILLSSGEGARSRIYRTADGGAHWTLLFTNPDSKGFFDSVVCRTAKQCLVLGDAVNGRMTIFRTSDGGSHWRRERTPEALPAEGAFAASNSSLVIRGRKDAWFGTGGARFARVFRSRDGGVTWAAVNTPVRGDGASAGIFSLAFRDSENGIAVGGDYRKDKETTGNIAITVDGGATWSVPPSGPRGFRSAVEYLPAMKVWITTGTSGSDVSRDGGKTWTQFDSGSFNVLSGLWAAGASGRIAVFSLSAVQSR
ncbi:MAG: glycosyl hydrolase [Acidobacteriota bacterium]|nr:glycosyl hydrolase [Acidobacteriota bacterium]